ncbi:GDSL-type esterase/lipase family protein [Rhizobium sp. NTR19]|uniref:GDSL-type esterase/lipase family protein n=1 Tax=Neorhizobium turbinariae TaxID=2937795 RepID=A0ABT0IUG9_9HYPH|nr:GDSL-type esterase/lipase family protein [Neorhizobium turbinariae]MCK8781503.1 GDSL-type esterase/lipase family protein [Neorhizobium turbinariae]
MGPYQYYTGANVSTAGNGLVLDAGHPIGVTGMLRAHCGFGTFVSGGGSFKPSWRRDNSPFSGLIEGTSVSAQTGAFGSTRTTLDLPADSLRNYPVRAQWSRPASGIDTMEPNFLLLWQRIERPDRTAGWSHNTLYGVGGQSLYDIAAWLIAQSDASLTNYFALLRSFHTAVGQDPVIVIRINSGANDRNETAMPSLGPAPSSDPDSAQAYVDNLAAIVLRIESIFSMNGWALSELHWLITPTHRLSDPDDAELVSYRDAAKAWAAARARTSVVDFAGMMSAAEAIASGWYDAGGAIHLTQAGYRALAVRELASGL